MYDILNFFNVINYFKNNYNFLSIYFIISEVKTISHNIQPKNEQVVRYHNLSSCENNYSLDLTAEDILDIAQ